MTEVNLDYGTFKLEILLNKYIFINRKITYYSFLSLNE